MYGVEDTEEAISPKNSSKVRPDGAVYSHKCPVCGKGFVSTKGLQQHQIIHTDKKPFVCNTCGKAFRFKSNLFEHRSVHTGAHPYVCQFCGKSCRLKGNLKKHLKTHSKDGDLDDSIDEGMPIEDSPHARELVAPPQFPAAAGKRKKTMRKRGQGAQHFKSTAVDHHGFDMSATDSYTFNDPELRDSKDDLFDLDAAVLFGNESSYLQTPASILANAKSMPEFLELAATLPFGDFHACSLCNKTFLSRFEAEKHMDQHRSENSLYCSICIKVFDSPYDYDKHLYFHQLVQRLQKAGKMSNYCPAIPAL